MLKHFNQNFIFILFTRYNVCSSSSTAARQRLIAANAAAAAWAV
jgi:hypothetical protein